MTNENRAWTRHGEAFWRAHHEAWKRSDLNQRQYCEAKDIPLKTFGNWRTIFKAERQPPERKLLYRRRGLSHTLNHSLNHTLSHGAYPFSAPVVLRPREGHRRRFDERTNAEFWKWQRNPALASRRWRAVMASTAVFYVVRSRS